MSRKRTRQVASKPKKSHPKKIGAAMTKDHYPKKQKTDNAKKNPPSQTKKSLRSQIQAAQKHINPFSPSDNILLVGEGDFSFALSLRKFHAVRRITATCFDSENKLGEKYPQAIENIASLFQISPSPILQTKESDDEFDDNDYDDGWQNLEDGGNDQRETDEKSKVTVAVYYSIDATKLHKQQRALKAQKFDRIAFMFPHVGGLTKDQDRQIHYNQELLQGYFKSARELLVPKTGTILVTLFEGMPYELWNIKALAKDAGLVTHRSFRFDASEYPGYKHVRTLGNIKGGGGGAWKVEDRLARVYVFGLEGVPPTQKKRMRHDGSDEE